MVKYFKNLGDLPFFAFSEGLNNQVTLNGAAWGIPAIKITDLDTAQNTFKPFFSAILSKKSRTPQQVKDHREQRTILEDFIEPFANQYIIPNTLISNSQVEVLGFNRKSEPGTRTAIDTEPHLTLKAKSDRRVLVENRVEDDSNRASCHPNSDGAEIRYTITTAATAGATPPASTDPATTAAGTATHKFSKKAKFTLQLADGDAGKIITMQSRWVNLTDETKNGPWSNPASTMVTW